MRKYISAINDLVSYNEISDVNIYLASEDPDAADLFEESCERTWKVYLD